jgi:rare lipoprotein A
MRVVGLPHRSGVLFVAFAALALGLTACSSVGSRPSNSRYDPRTGVSASVRLVPPGAPVPKGGRRYKLGAPYKISGRWYIPKEEPDYDQTGIASWYGSDFHGRATANGEIFDMAALTAAHPTLPLPSYAYVTNLENGRTVLVRINDRGPYAHDRVIDLSREVARALGSEGRGLARVRVRYAGRAPLNGDDRHERAYLASQPWFGGAGERRVAGHSGSYLRQW